MRSNRLKRFVNGASAFAFVLVLGVSLVVLAAEVVRPSLSQPFLEGLSHDDFTPVVVEPGDTIWALAVEHFPGIDPRLASQAIQSINNLPDALIYPGQIILLPSLDGQPTLRLAVNQNAY